MLPSPALDAITLMIVSCTGQSMMIASTCGYSGVGARLILEGGVVSTFNLISRITSAGVFLGGSVCDLRRKDVISRMITTRPARIVMFNMMSVDIARPRRHAESRQ